MTPQIDPKFRVIRISDSLRDEIKQARDARGTTNAALVEAANGDVRSRGACQVSGRAARFLRSQRDG
jgi:hypothetical protein